MKSGLKEEAFKWRRGKKKKWEGSLKKMHAGSEVAGEGLVELQRGTIEVFSSQTSVKSLKNLSSPLWGHHGPLVATPPTMYA